jgi:hypothetical protein
MKKIFNDEEFAVLTHFDLDGAGSALMFKHACQKQIIMYKSVGYGKITKLLNSIECKNLVITDLSLTQEQVQIANSNFTNVIWIDHHETSIDIECPKHWIVHINTKACGTKLSYLYLKHLGYDMQIAKDFVNCVNDYDMWILKDPDSVLLNNMFWDLKFFPFIENFENFEFSPKLREKAQQLQQVKEAEIAKFDNFLLDNVLRVIVANTHISDISLFYTKEDYHVIIRNKGAVSFRSKKDMTPFYNELEKLNIPSGGHKFAGGCELKGTEYEDNHMDVIEIFYNFVKEQNEFETISK